MKSSDILLLLPAAALLPNMASAQKRADKGVEAQKPLNIIYVMTDDHSFQTLSCYDTTLVKTPNLDRMAKAGVRFTNSFVCNSISGPSRAVLLTGKHSHKNGMVDNSTVFDGSQQTFPKLLQKSGYNTAIIGKWHLGGTPTGFDFWRILPGQGSYYNPDFITSKGKEHYNGYVTTIITDMGIDYLKNRDRSKPFCLLLHHKAVHRVWAGDSADLKLYEDKTFKIPETFYDDYAGRPAAAAQEMSIIAEDMDLKYDLKIKTDSIKSRFGDDPHHEYFRMNDSQKKAWDAVYEPITQDFLARKLEGKELAEWKYQRYMRDYLKSVKSLDDNMGRLLDYLEKEGLTENTVIVYTSDQGFYMGEHGWFDKRFMYEESLRTPLLMMLPPQLKKRGDIPQMVQNIDHAATFLDIAGVEKPADIDGESVLPLLEGKNPKDWRKSIYYHYFEYPAEHAVRRHYGVRTDRYKLIRFYGHDIENWELYDLRNDPHELHNLYGDEKYSKIAAKLHKELDSLRVKYNDNKE